MPYDRYDRTRILDRKLTREIHALRRAVVSLEEKLTFLDVERGNLASIVSKMITGDIIIQPQNPTKGEISPLRRKQTSTISQLPPEVLRIIFMHCLPEAGNAVLSPHELPLLFGRVCRLWRDLAWSTPALWDTLHIVIPALDYEPFLWEKSKWNGCIVAVGNWLKRSGTRPLSLSLADDETHYFNDPHPCHVLISKVLQQISTESARWKDLRLRLRGMDMKLHSQALPREFPMLETFAFRNLDESAFRPCIYINSRHDAGFHPIIAAPSLRTLQLCDVSMLGIYSRDGPRMNNYSNIVELSLGDDSRTTGFFDLEVDDTLSILTQLQHSQLRTCQLVVRPLFRDENAAPPTTEIKLGWLQDLTIVVSNELYDEDEEDVDEDEDPEDDKMLEEHLFSILRLPSLSSFEYRNRSRGHSTFPFLPLLSNPHQVETLRLYASTSSDPFKRLVGLCAGIKELHLSAELSYSLDTMEAAFPDVDILKLDCSVHVDRPQLLLDIHEGRGTAWPKSWQNVPEPTLRRFVERARHEILHGRIGFIRHRNARRLKPASDKPASHYSPLRYVEFRLNERLRARALAMLKPFIKDGLRISFRDDYFDIPPPSRLSNSAGQSWNLSTDSH